MYLGSKLDERVSFEILDKYYSSGGNFIDTANNYAFWVDGCVGDESEVLIGRWLESRKNRDDIVIATKIGARPRTNGNGLSDGEGLSAKSIETAVEHSLRRLRTDRIDLYFAHIFDAKVPLEETLTVFDVLVKKGKVRAVGCSNHRAYQIEQARSCSRSLDTTEYVAIQQRHSFLRPKPYSEFVGGVQIAANEDLLHLCEVDKKISLLAYSPLLGGLYNKDQVELPAEYDSPENRSDMVRLKLRARELGVTGNQLVLAWMMNGRNGIIPLIAASNLGQLNENLEADSIRLSKEDVRQIGWWG